MDSFDNGSTNKPPRLVRGDFLMWKRRMMNFMIIYDQRMWNAVENGPYVPSFASPDPQEDGRVIIKEPKDFTEDDKEKIAMDKKALGMISMALPNDIYQSLLHCETSKSLWKALEELLEGTPDVQANRGQLLVQQYELFTHIAGETLSQQFERFMCLISELRVCGREYNNEDLLNKFMRSLPSQWRTITIVIRKTKDLSKLTLPQLHGELRTFELEVQQDTGAIQGKRTFDSPASNAALATPPASQTYVQPHSRIPEDSAATTPLAAHASSSAQDLSNQSRDDIDCVDADDLEEEDILSQMAFVSMRMKKFTRRTGRNFTGHQGTVKKIMSSFDKTRVKCYNCSRLGHFASECRAPKADNSQHTSRNPPQPTQHKSFVTGEAYDWSFLTEDGASFALMANDNEVTPNSIPCFGCFDVFSRKTKYADGLSETVNRLHKEVQQLEATAREHKSIVSRYEEKLKISQKEITRLDNESSCHRAQVGELVKKLTSTREELAINKSLVEKWSRSSNDFQRMLDAQIHSSEKFGLGYNVTKPPYDYTPKIPTVEEDVSPKPEIRSEKVEPPKVPECTGTTEPKTAEKPSCTNTLKPIKFVKGKTESGSPSNSKGLCDCAVKKAVSTSEATKRVDKGKAKASENKAKSTPVLKKKVISEMPEAKGILPTPRNLGKPTYVSTQKQAFQPRIKKCFICGYANHLAIACYHNPCNQIYASDFQRQGMGWGRPVPGPKAGAKRSKKAMKNAKNSKKKTKTPSAATKVPTDRVSAPKQPKVKVEVKNIAKPVKAKTKVATDPKLVPTEVNAEREKAMILKKMGSAANLYFSAAELDNLNTVLRGELKPVKAWVPKCN